MRKSVMLLVLAVVAPLVTTPWATAAGLTWQQGLHIRGIFDVVGPRSDGRLVVAARGGLYLVGSTRISRFAPTYSPSNGEAYITMSPGVRDMASHCGFARDAVAALALAPGRPGVVLISPVGHVFLLAHVTRATNLFGITIDATGRFGHRIVVVGRVSGGHTRIWAIDCLGRVTAVATVGVPLEGGIAIAPSTFGAYAGQLIAPNELDGSIYALSPAGQLRTVVRSGLHFGPDIGVESLGFVPAGGPGGADVADRATPGGRHPGDDRILTLSGAALRASGVVAGDLLAATEGGATLIRVRCIAACSVARLVPVPTSAHGEGSVVVAPTNRTPSRNRGTPT